MFVAVVVTIASSWIVRRQAPQKVDRWFRRLQLVSAAAFSLGHGTNDAQKGMGIITAALVTGGALQTYEVPFWVIISCHAAIAGGTLAGGWRVIKTMGQRITKLTPFGGERLRIVTHYGIERGDVETFLDVLNRILRDP